MNTTVICTENTGKVISALNKELKDMIYMCVSGDVKKLPALYSELVLFVADCEPEEADRLHSMVTSAAGNCDLVMDFVILPFGYDVSPKDYHTAGRNVFFFPRNKVYFDDESAYYEYCLNEAIHSIKLLKRLTYCIESNDVFMYLSKQDLISQLKYYFESENCKYIVSAKGDFNSCMDTIYNYKLVNSDTSAIIIMMFVPRTSSLHYDLNKKDPIVSKGGKTMLGMDFVEGTDEIEIVELIVNLI